MYCTVEEIVPNKIAIYIAVPDIEALTVLAVNLLYPVTINWSFIMAIMPVLGFITLKRSLVIEQDVLE